MNSPSWLNDEEIAVTARQEATIRGCTCGEEVPVQIVHLNGQQCVQANIPHPEECPMYRGQMAVHVL